MPHQHTAHTPPVITAARARADGISPGSLQATAAWNERKAKGAAKDRRLAQAAELRRVAAQLAAMVASNDNAGVHEVAA